MGCFQIFQEKWRNIFIVCNKQPAASQIDCQSASDNEANVHLVIQLMQDPSQNKH